MSKKLTVYKCQESGLMVEVLGGVPTDIACCGKLMTELKENTTDAAVEKHVPVVERVNGGVKVSVGSAAHPMAEEHWIEWIEVIAGSELYRKYLSAGDAPEAFFPVSAEDITVRSYCNLHGLWKA